MKIVDKYSNNHATCRVIPGRSDRGDAIEVECVLGETRHDVFFRTGSHAVLSGHLESLLATTILPFMTSGGGCLVAEGEVSHKFLSGLSTIQDIYGMWDPSLRRAEITDIQPVGGTGPDGDRVGVFFSGGVDSFYTFLKHRDQITDLIFVHGFDIALSDTALRTKVSAVMGEVASSFGKGLVEIETNVRTFLDQYVHWGFFGHGAALAAVGHLLRPAFRQIFIPASYTYANLFPWGSHPLLDPRWSSESLEFIHDGCEVTRVEKVKRIATNDVAMRNLRVCYENRNSAYNCGQCDKCLRTMINLKVNGALDRCATFDGEPDVRKVLKIDVEDESTRAFVRENLAALKAWRGDGELLRALQKAMDRPRWYKRLRRGLSASKRRIKGILGR